MIRWIDVRDISLLVVFLMVVGWTLMGCSTPPIIADYQKCLSCGVEVPRN